MFLAMDMYDDFENSEHRFWYAILMSAAAALFLALGTGLILLGVEVQSSMASVICYVSALYFNANVIVLLNEGWSTYMQYR